MWTGVEVVGAGMVVALAGKTVLGEDSRHAVVVADRNHCCWWLEAEAQSLRLGAQTARCDWTVAPLMEEWARMVAGCRVRDRVPA